MAPSPLGGHERGLEGGDQGFQGWKDIPLGGSKGASVGGKEYIIPASDSELPASENGWASSVLLTRTRCQRELCLMLGSPVGTDPDSDPDPNSLVATKSWLTLAAASKSVGLPSPVGSSIKKSDSEL